jgi:hypothetical protein
LSHQSEKLSIAIKAINTILDKAFHIRKSLWVWKDCHTSTKFISKIVGRIVMVRDVIRCHTFENVVCSCMIYWWCQ